MQQPRDRRATACCRFANHAGDVDVPHRSMISLTFGRKNSFSDAFDRGFAMRAKIYSMRSSPCANLKARRRLTAA